MTVGITSPSTFPGQQLAGQSILLCSSSALRHVFLDIPLFLVPWGVSCDSLEMLMLVAKGVGAYPSSASLDRWQHYSLPQFPISDLVRLADLLESSCAPLHSQAIHLSRKAIEEKRVFTNPVCCKHESQCNGSLKVRTVLCANVELYNNIRIGYF